MEEEPWFWYLMIALYIVGMAIAVFFVPGILASGLFGLGAAFFVVGMIVCVVGVMVTLGYRSVHGWGERCPKCSEYKGKVMRTEKIPGSGRWKDTWRTDKDGGRESYRGHFYDVHKYHKCQSCGHEWTTKEVQESSR